MSLVTDHVLSQARAGTAPAAGRPWTHPERNGKRCAWYRVGWRAGAALVAVSSVLLGVGPSTWAQSARHTPGGAGRYLAVLTASCTSAAAKTKACQAVLGPFASGINPLYVTCDAAERCTFDDTFAISEHSAGAPAVCGPTIVTKPFDGTCRGSDHGALRIKKGVTGLPDIWVVAETTTFYGSRTISGIANPFGTNIDSGIPLVPGVYDTARYLHLVGQSPTPGFAIQILVTKLPA